jgi:eukaryotic-like serine/threonine-protein kinase
MTSGNWEEAWQIYNAACELPFPEQRAFVESQSSDPATVRKVLDLLASLDAEDQPREVFHPDRAGTQCGRYEVAALLGRGGMGEVYAARDTDLDRPVALKFLRVESIGDPRAVNRFIREAKAASALNHPNILTIHEVIDSSSGLAIATELVQGKPLNELRGAPVATRQVVEIGKQAAAALAAAHELGIVHRDIKPENLMLRADGFLKVLDFGLARRVDASSGLTTKTGSLSGTLRYMSPEQLRGEPLTGASDVFSLGLVLYELAAGRHPFDSKYGWETAHLIHMQDPEPPSASNRETPAWLDRLIIAMLNRDAALRPGAGEVAEAFAGEGTAWQPGQRVRPRWKQVVAAIAAVVVVSAAWSLHDLLPPWKLKAVEFTAYPGDESMPTFSPDGQKVAFVWNGPGRDNPDIYVRAIGSTAIQRITTDPDDDMSPAWSPTGPSIAFVRKPRNTGLSSLMIVPGIGGPERKITDLLMTRYHNFPVLAWTPDGKWVVAPSRETDQEPVGLFLISPVDGSKIRLTRPPPDEVDFDPAIAPDGRMLAFTRWNSDSVSSIFLLPLSATFMAAGEPQSLPSFPNLRVGSPQWTADSKELLFVANPNAGVAIWRMRVPKIGEAPESPRREMFAGLSSSITIGRLSTTAHRLMYSSEVLETNLWRVPLGTAGAAPALQRIGAPTEQNSGARISPDGSSIVFESMRTGSTEIWAGNVDGSNPRQLTHFGGPVTGSPAWSPDGKRIAFDSRAEGRPHIYVVAATGGSPERITDVLAENYIPSWSRDGQWIYFSSSRSGPVEVWRQPAAGGPAEQITHGGGRAAIESPDGAVLYYERMLAGGRSLRRLILATAEDVEVLPPITDRAFAVARDGIYYAPLPGPDGSFSIRFLDLRTGVSRLVTPIQKPMTRGLSISPDGSFLLYSQFDRWGHDLMLVENFR